MKTKLTTTLCITMLFSVAVSSAMEEVDALKQKEDKYFSASVAKVNRDCKRYSRVRYSKKLSNCAEKGNSSEYTSMLLGCVRAENKLELAKIKKNELLLDGAYNGNLKAVRKLLSRKAEVDCQNEWGRTPLMRASHRDNLEIVRLLLTNRADVNQKKDGECTALMGASSCGNLNIAKLLLENKADVNYQDDGGYTALIKASWGGYSDLVRLLLDSRADVSLENNHGWTALTEAAFAGNLEILRALIAYNADVNWKHKEGWTTLIKVSEEGYHEIVEELLKSRANANIQDNKSRTALMKASRRGHNETAKLLLEIGEADPKKKDNEGRTALGSALRHHSWNSLEVTDPDKQNGEGRVAVLMEAVESAVLMEAVKFANTSSKLLDLLIRSLLEADFRGAESFDGRGEVADLFNVSIGSLLQADRSIEANKLFDQREKYRMILDNRR